MKDGRRAHLKTITLYQETFGDSLRFPKRELFFEIDAIALLCFYGQVRLAEAISLRYGLADGRVRTFQECADEWEITGQRFRQIFAKGIRQIRKYLVWNNRYGFYTSEKSSPAIMRRRLRGSPLSKLQRRRLAQLEREKFNP